MTQALTYPKTCIKCGQRKLAADFPPNKNTCRECYRARRRELYAANPERQREKDKRYKAAHPDRVKARHKRYYEETRPQKLEYVRARHANLKARQVGAPGRITPKQWEAVANHYAPDGKCLACGEVARMSLDHVVPFSMGGPNTAANIQPLCVRCNARKKDRAIDYRPDRGAYARALLAHDRGKQRNISSSLPHSAVLWHTNIDAIRRSPGGRVVI